MEEGLLNPFSWYRFQLITYLNSVPDKIIKFSLLLTYIIGGEYVGRYSCAIAYR